MTTFESDLASGRQALDDARAQLLAVVDSLAGADLDRARRGGWPVRRVLHHVIQGQCLYTGAIGYLKGSPTPASMPQSAPGSPAEAREQLEASGAAFVSALEGVSEDAFYTVRPVGHEEYSVLSLLENVANHDCEHAAQIRAIVADVAP